jgi:uncharacterized protein (TIGR00288 family)
VSPWWLRPTAESEKTKDEETEETAQDARGDEAPRGDEPEPDAAAESAADAAPGTEDEDAAPGAERPARRRRSSRSRRPAREEGDEDEPETAAAEPAPAQDAEESPAEDAAQSARRPRGGRGRSRRESSGPKETPPKEKPAQEKAAQEPPAKEARRERPRKEREVRTHDITPEDIAAISRELAAGFPAPTPTPASEPVPERTHSVNDERKIALFCDLENVALGVRDSDIKKFDITLVLERLLEKGKVIVKRAYCDWERYSEYKRAFHESAIEMLDIPQKYYSGKNSADIKMVVDALDLCYAKEHLDTFVLLSGDSDFSPLVSKLRENDKYVIGMGVKNSSSALLVDNCDEFIYYEDIWRDRQRAPQVAGMNKKATEAFSLMTDAIQALLRENKDVLWGSMIKQTMQRKKPSFNEGYYGFGSFSELLEDAEKRGILKLKKDQRSGSYVVTGFAKR